MDLKTDHNRSFVPRSQVELYNCIIISGDSHQSHQSIHRDSP